MGLIVQGKGLWRALFTRTQRRLLGLLYGYPDRSFYANELVRRAGVGTGAVQRELARMSEAGILTVTPVGNQVHYQANPACPFFPELRSMVVKTFGALDLLRGALHSLDGAVELAFVHGEEALRVSGEGAPLRLFLVSPDLTRARAERVLAKAAARLGRGLELVVLRPSRFQRLLDEEDARLLAVLAEPRLVLVGEDPAPAGQGGSISPGGPD